MTLIPRYSRVELLESSMGREEGVGVPPRFLGGTLDEVAYLSVPSSSTVQEALLSHFPSYWSSSRKPSSV